VEQVVLNKPGQLVLQNVPDPAAAKGQALVRVHRVGVCGTDLHAFKGQQPFFDYPRVLGHELAVEVIEVPENHRGIKPGDLCAVEPYLNCGQCHACRIGKPNCCENNRTLGVQTDGAMQTLFALPVEKLHKSRKLTPDQLALIETLGVGAHAVRRGNPQPGADLLLVVGAGPIGLGAVQFAQALGVNVRVLELNPHRREFVARLGIETLAEPDDRLAEVVIDATGNPKAMEASFQLVAFGGTLVFVGVCQDRISFDDPLFHRREMTVKGSRNSLDIFPKLIEMIEDGRIDTTPWITHRMNLVDVPREFPTLYEKPSLVKAVIEVTAGTSIE